VGDDECFVDVVGEHELLTHTLGEIAPHNSELKEPVWAHH
jgi:hypothetical protein